MPRERRQNPRVSWQPTPQLLLGGGGATIAAAPLRGRAGCRREQGPATDALPPVLRPEGPGSPLPTAVSTRGAGVPSPHSRQHPRGRGPLSPQPSAPSKPCHPRFWSCYVITTLRTRCSALCKTSRLGALLLQHRLRDVVAWWSRRRSGNFHF